MPANPPVPRRTRALAGFARWALALALALWLLAAALWGLLHGWIVPRIDQWRAPVQTWAAQRLGVPVRIGAIAAHAVPGGLRIELADVQLPALRPAALPVSAPAPDGAGGLAADALHLPRVVVTLSLRALLRLGVEQVYVEGAQLHLHRSRDGAVHLAAGFGTGGASVLDWALVDAVAWLQARGKLKKAPVHGAVAAVSVGIWRGVPVLDLDYAEDSDCDTDMNVVMNDGGGFIELQGTAEGHAFRREELAALLGLADSGIQRLLEYQRQALAQ